MGKREGAVGSDRNRIPPSADTPPPERETGDLGPHAPASPYPKPEPAPEAGGYEAPAPKNDSADIVDH